MAKPTALFGRPAFQSSKDSQQDRRREESGRTDTNYLRAREIPILFAFGEARMLASSET